MYHTPLKSSDMPVFAVWIVKSAAALLMYFMPFFLSTYLIVSFTTLILEHIDGQLKTQISQVVLTESPKLEQLA